MDRGTRLQHRRRLRMCGSALVLVAAVATVAVSSSAAPAKKRPYSWSSPTWSPNGAILAFAGTSARSHGVFRATAAGKQLRPIAVGKVLGSTSQSPQEVGWSPRGTKVVWAQRFGSRQDDVAIFVGDARRRGMRRIARRGEQPTWGPSGRLIAYTGVIGIHLVRPDGRGDSRLTSGRFDRSPTWSPNGKYLAFTRPTTNAWSADGIVYVIRRDGTGLRQLTAGAGADPEWSPDGRQIAYAVLDGKGGSLIHVLDVDGTHDRVLTTSWAAGGQRWSPNSQLLVFTRLVKENDLSEDPSIAVIARDGSGGERFLARTGWSGGPVWSPGGRRIAYVGELRCGFSIFVVSAGGGRSRQVTPCRY